MPAAGDLIYAGGYRLLQTVYVMATTTFAKADYAGLAAV